MQKRRLLPLAIIGVTGLLLLLFSAHLAHQSFVTHSAPVITPISSVAKPTIRQESSKADNEPAKSAYKLWLEAKPENNTDQPRFYKVSAEGTLLEQDATFWRCVYDASTALLWEVKTNDGSWQDYEHTYSWYAPDEEESGVALLSEDPPATWGIKNGGRCYDISCDTYHYEQAVNDQQLCESRVWRLPYAYELASLDHVSNYSPDINTDYFPYTASASYWSRTEPPAIHETKNTLAWRVNFLNGFPYISEKRLRYHVRLVADALWFDDTIIIKPQKNIPLSLPATR